MRPADARLREAFAAEEDRGLVLATRLRLAGVAVIAAWTLLENRFPGGIYYFWLVVLFGLTGVAPLALRRLRVGGRAGLLDERRDGVPVQVAERTRQSAAQAVPAWPASQRAQRRPEVEPCLESIAQRRVAHALVREPLERDRATSEPVQESALGGGGKKQTR